MFETVVPLILLAMLIGVAAGFLAGFFGVGGGVILVPVFLALFHWLFPQAGSLMKEAVGTALFLVIPAGVAAVRRQHQLGNLNAKQAVHWAFFVAAGAVLGAVASRFVHADVLKVVFLSYLVFCLALLFFVKERSEATDKSPQGLVVRVIAPAIGFLSVLLGIGGGTLATPILRAYGCSMKKALAFASATTVAVGVLGSVGVIVTGWNEPGRLPYSLGYISLVAALLIGPFMFWASPKGVSAAHRLSKETMRVLYILFLLSIFGFMLCNVLLP